jgi:hypothetical protein
MQCSLHNIQLLHCKGQGNGIRQVGAVTHYTAHMSDDEAAGAVSGVNIVVPGGIREAKE